MNFEEVRQLALSLPEVEDGTSYGTPAWKLKGKLLARFWEDRHTLVILHVGFDERDMLIEAAPETFFFTDHYRNYPSVLARIGSLEPATLRRLLEQGWRAVAPKRLSDRVEPGK